MTDPAILCAYSKLVAPAKLKPHPRNPNKHSENQVSVIAKAIVESGWRHPVIVSKRSGLIVAGHGRVMAAIYAGIKSVPVEIQDFETDAAELAFLVADNRLSALSDLDDVAISEILETLTQLGASVSSAGYDQSALIEMVNEIEAKERRAVEREQAAQQRQEPAATASAANATNGDSTQRPEVIPVGSVTTRAPCKYCGRP